MLGALLQGLVKRLPSRCAICHAWPSEPLCQACVARFTTSPNRCRSCALPVPAGVTVCGACLREPPALDACLAVVPYAYPWSELIGQFKFGANPALARSLAQIMRSSHEVDEALDRCDWLLPLPLSPQRLRERGFNQTLELARHLAATKVDAGLLLRLRHTPPQSTLTRAQRLRNVEQAFAVDPLRIGELAGRRVVLVDDVMTSGASLFAAARAVREAGAAHITGLVLARTETQGR